MRTYSTDCKALFVSQLFMRIIPLLFSHANLTPRLWLIQVFLFVSPFNGYIETDFEDIQAPIGLILYF